MMSPGRPSRAATQETLLYKVICVNAFDGGLALRRHGLPNPLKFHVVRRPRAGCLPSATPAIFGAFRDRLPAASTSAGFADDRTEFTRADPAPPHRRGDEAELHQLLDERHRLPRAPRRAGRAQAGAPPDPLRDERAGP